MTPQAAEIKVTLNKVNTVWVPGFQPMLMNNTDLIAYLTDRQTAPVIKLEYQVIGGHEAQIHKTLTRRANKIAQAIGAAVSPAANKVVDGYTFPNHFVVTLTR